MESHVLRSVLSLGYLNIGVHKRQASGGLSAIASYKSFKRNGNIKNIATNLLPDCCRTARHFTNAFLNLPLWNFCRLLKMPACRGPQLGLIASFSKFISFTAEICYKMFFYQ